MYGAIIGDLAGSIYEYSQIRKISPVVCNQIIEDISFISDDTILTIAVLDAILNNKDYGDTIKQYGIKYMDFLPDFKPYFKSVFSKGFINWINSNQIGISAGNGAMMRISPVGYMFDTEEDVLNNAKLVTIPSHNCNESIECATIIAMIIFYARKGFSKSEIIDKLKLKVAKPKIEKFNTTCYETMNICLYVLFNSSSFEECIHRILLYGGDTDTNACIVGSMAEALYGINSTLVDKANRHIPEEFQKKLTLAYSKLEVI